MISIFYQQMLQYLLKLNQKALGDLKNGFKIM
jgi:hypothetical protein